MRVLITGGAGFIGAHLAAAFHARGDAVAVADDLSRGQPEFLTAGVELYKVSVTNSAAVRGLVADVMPHVICHLAAQTDVRVSLADPAVDATVNVTGTINVLQAARGVDARVILASSAAVYGDAATGPLSEDATVAPASPYGASKACAESYLRLYNRLHGTAHSILRLANVYGPRQDANGEGGVVAIFCARVLAGQPLIIYGDGHQTRDFVYVGDVARAFVMAAGHGRPGTWNVGTGVETSVMELAAAVSATERLPLDYRLAPARPSELRRSALASALAAAELGWRPRIALVGGVRAVLGWLARR